MTPLVPVCVRPCRHSRKALGHRKKNVLSRRIRVRATSPMIDHTDMTTQYHPQPQEYPTSFSHGHAGKRKMKVKKEKVAIFIYYARMHDSLLHKWEQPVVTKLINNTSQKNPNKHKLHKQSKDSKPL